MVPEKYALLRSMISKSGFYRLSFCIYRNTSVACSCFKEGDGQENEDFCYSYMPRSSGGVEQDTDKYSNR